PIPEVLTYLSLPRRPQRPCSLQLAVPAGAVMHRGDMDWLKAGTYDFMLDCADKYWTGQPMTATPVWEVLLALPVTATLTPLP
ncbi:hypothetical protein, partial [Rhodococcoides fascians]|uniref:hypothetical protein n=1 Tax=Rhodococcoides fascians TaxID=1828 RepID=UPI001E3C0FDD